MYRCFAMPITKDLGRLAGYPNPLGHTMTRHVWWVSCVVSKIFEASYFVVHSWMKASSKSKRAAILRSHKQIAWGRSDGSAERF